MIGDLRHRSSGAVAGRRVWPPRPPGGAGRSQAGAPSGRGGKRRWKVLVLLHRTRQLFEAWELWPQIRAAAEPLTEMRLKVAGFPLTSSLGAGDAGVPALAYSLPYDDLTGLARLAP